jgi:cytochrome c-type biogenesis protein
MNTARKTAIVIVLAAAIAVVAVEGRRGAPASTEKSGPSGLPRLVDLGAETCTACKMMAPILDELREECAGKLDVEFINVHENEQAAEHYDVYIIPLQVFLDGSGKELWRHEGFLSKADIVAKWREFGVDLEASEEGFLSRLFGGLSRAVEGAPAIALLTALVWGALSVLLSPCHLASIPLIVAFIDQQGQTSRRRACLVATLFAVGILVTIAVIGVATRLAGTQLGKVGPVGNYVAATVFFLAGLCLLDVVPVPWGPGHVKTEGRGLLAAFLLGLVSGVALGPCTFAYMAPVLGVVMLPGTSHLYAALLLGVYGVGHCAVIVVAGTSTGLVQRYLTWGETSGGTTVLKRVCGVLVLVGGLYMVYLAR